MRTKYSWAYEFIGGPLDGGHCRAERPITQPVAVCIAGRRYVYQIRGAVLALERSEELTCSRPIGAAT